MTPKQEMICRQLVLRAVVWDAEDLDKNERKKLEEEIQAFRIRRIQVKRRQNAAQQPHSVYNGIQKALRKAGISEKTALLVTGDAALAQYVYDCGNKKDSDGNSRRRQNAGMGVVFYEKSGSRAAAAADMVVLGFEEIGVQFLDRVQKRRNRLPWIILYTKRTYVREITVQDLDALYALYEEEGITDYTEPLFEREKEELYTESYIDHRYYYYGYGMWVVCDTKTGALIGRAGIEHREVEGEVCMELGYVIGTAYQRQGYATEVCASIVAYAKEELEIEQLHCFIHPNNKGSLRVAQKLGFTQCQSKEHRQGELWHFSMEL